MATTSSSSRISFGLYEVDLQGGELWRGGFRVKLQIQPFKVLTLLLERPGEVVTREELKARLWDGETTVDFDHSLATAVNKIRDALRDSAENPRFVETLARRGYRFIAPVSYPPETPRREPIPHLAVFEATAEAAAVDHHADQVTPTASASAPVSINTVAAGTVSDSSPSIPVSGVALTDVHPARPQIGSVSRTLRRELVWAALLVTAVLCALFGYIAGVRRSSVAPPHITQLTHNGHLAAVMGVNENLTASATDGYRLFVPVIEGGRADLATVSVSGGPLLPLSLPDEVASPILGDISPDGQRLLVRNHLSPESEQPLWVVPTSGGSALRVGSVLAHDATWMPDGNGILYANGTDLFVTHVNDNRPVLFASLPGRAFWLRWSPSAKLLRFTVIDPIAHTQALWQLAASDRKATRILTDLAKPSLDCCGVWTSDGGTFVFQSTQGGNSDLWKLAGDSTSDPTRLTDGPLQFQSPLAARSGNTIFFLGVDDRSQLERVTSSGELVPEKGFLAPAVRVEYTRDRKSVAWTDKSGRLWRSETDGSQKLQLTPDLMDVFLARWSPDGSRLALMARQPGEAWKIYLVAGTGGDLQPLLAESRNAADPSWSPDGQSIVFGRVNDPLGKENASRMLSILHLSTGQVEPIPGSENLFSPRWSPDGRFIAALSLDQRQVRLFDVAAHTWKTLPVHSGADPIWSPDSHFLYLHESLDPSQPIDRISVPDGTVQQLVHLSDSSGGGAVDYILSGLTEDNQPLVVERTFTGNIYSMQAK